MTSILLGVLGGAGAWAAGELYRQLEELPFTRAEHGRLSATRFHTVLTEGIHFRGRIGGRLYALEVWREHV